MDGLKLSPFLAAIGVAALAAYGCGSPVKSEKAITPPFTIPSGTWVDPSNPDPDEDPSEVAGFFVKVTSTTAAVTVHRADTAYGGNPGTTNFTTECRIASGTTVPADMDILCIAEVEELDAFFSELTIQYHFPPSMCSYAKFTPYHYYAMEPGDGPAALTVTRDVAGTVIANSAGVNATTGAPECEFDYSDNGDSGPNCCMGDYSLTTTQQNTAPDPDTITTTLGEWGGSDANCLSGPGKSTEWSSYISSDGYPLTKVYYAAGEGVNSTFKILAPLNTEFFTVRLRSNVWMANHYQVADHSAQSPLVLPADRPLALRYPEDVADPYLPADTYKFECHNRAEEILYRIRLMIREWNTDPITSGGDPEVNVGTDPNFPDGPINDRRDWFDIGNAYPGAMH